MSPKPSLSTYLICFYDIRGFTRVVESRSDIEVFELLDAMAHETDRCVGDSGGQVVKYIGDAALIIYPEETADAGVRALLDLKPALEQILADRATPAQVVFAVHIGEIAIGPFGSKGNIDIMGSAVNTTATLERTPCKSNFIISAQAFRNLEPETRKRFHKFTAPVVYTA